MVGPNSPHLKATLDLIRNPEELWSDFGIRSLSKKDPFYGTEENYWRSPVWVNMNYMVLKNLYVCSSGTLIHELGNINILTFC
jgi:mannosyl-oligosaccharide glucosidase